MRVRSSRGPCDPPTVMSEPLLGADVADDPSPVRTSAPMLGPAIAIGYLILAATWTYLPLSGAGFDKAIWFAHALTTTFVAVAVPLMIKGIPGALRRRAAPFLIVAGALVLLGVAVPSPYLWGPMNITLLYVMGWLQLRDRPPLALWAALGGPALMLIFQLLTPGVARHLTTTPGQATPGTQALWQVAYTLLMGVLPVAIPVVLAGLAQRYRATPPGQQSPPSPDPDWNAFAVASLVCVFVGGLPMAIAFGHVALAQIRRSHERGAGLATAALVLGYFLLIALAIVAYLLYLAFRDFTITF